jgi:hypothetical protein
VKKMLPPWASVPVLPKETAHGYTYVLSGSFLLRKFEMMGCVTDAAEGGTEPEIERMGGGGGEGGQSAGACLHEQLLLLDE